MNLRELTDVLFGCPRERGALGGVEAVTVGSFRLVLSGGDHDRKPLNKVTQAEEMKIGQLTTNGSI